MKLVIIEPLGVEEEKLMEVAHKALPDSVEIVSYQTKVTDTESLIERGKDAENKNARKTKKYLLLISFLPFYFITFSLL